MTLPRKAVLGSFVYRITDRPADWKRLAPEIAVDEDWWGYTHHASGTILIQPGMNPPPSRGRS